MNIHSFIDSTIVSLTKKFAGKRRLFSERVDSPSISELVKTLKLEVPEIKKTGLYKVEAETPAGKLMPQFMVYKWFGSEYPTYIYHHGNSERPLKIRHFARNTFYKIFVHKDTPVKANLIALVSPLHVLSGKEMQKRYKDIKNITVSLALTAVLVEKIVDQIRKTGSGLITVSGISLGGFVTNMHRAFFNTADIYIPILAGAALGDVFIRSDFEALTSELFKQNHEKIRKIMNFDMEFMGISKRNVFPLLGRFDRFIEVETHIKCYGSHPLKIVNRGHVTAAFSAKMLRDHVFYNSL